MRVPLSWLADHLDVPADPDAVADMRDMVEGDVRFTRAFGVDQ